MTDSSEIKIVLIEDSETIAELLRERILLKFPAQVLTFNNGSEAWDHFLKVCQSGLKEIPDLIILDLGMPGMGGLELLQKITDSPEFQAIPIIVNTGSQDLEEILEVKKRKNVTFLKKTMGSASLEQTIEKLRATKVIKK